MNQVYLDTARLMIQVAPLVFADNVFALKESKPGTDPIFHSIFRSVAGTQKRGLSPIFPAFTAVADRASK